MELLTLILNWVEKIHLKDKIAFKILRKTLEVTKLSSLGHIKIHWGHLFTKNNQNHYKKIK